MPRPRFIAYASLLWGLFLAPHQSLGAEEAVTDTWPLQRGTPAGAAWGKTSPHTEPWQDWAFQGRPKQTYQRGVPVWGSPAFAVVDGRPLVFIGGSDQTLYALDLALRRRVWLKVTNGFIMDSPVVAWVAGKQIVFWGSSDRYLYAHAAQDGQRLWTRELISPTNTQGEAHIPAPFYDQGVLYTACFIYDKALVRNQQQAWLLALEAASGRELWRYELPPGPMSAPVGCRIDGELVLFQASRRGVLQGLRVSRRGAVPAWSFQMPHEVLGSPAVLEGEDPLLFLGSKFGDVIALDARTGRKRWSRMTGNWVDNNVVCGRVDGRDMVFVGSNDYSLYALNAADGGLLWRRPLGDEVYSAPGLFQQGMQTLVAAACLDDHLYVVDGATGEIRASFYTGEPTWDKVAKGETVWGSPIAVTAGDRAVLVHGSYDGAVYLLPMAGANRFRAAFQGSSTIWFNLAVVGLVFSLVILPVVLRWGRRTKPPA